MSKILVATTMAPYAALSPHPEASQNWLAGAEQLIDRTIREGHTIEYLAMLETDARGEAPYRDVRARLRDLDVLSEIRYFSMVDMWDRVVTSNNRLWHICTGRNLIQQYAIKHDFDYILFVDADTSVPEDAVVKLLELDWPLTGGHVPTYVLDGPRIARIKDPHTGVEHDYRDIDVRLHMNTAGFLLVARDIFRRVWWRIDPDEKMTDDPCYNFDAAQLGYATLVRHDIEGRHFPESITPMEDRYSAQQRTVVQ